MNNIKKSNLYNCLHSIAVFPTHELNDKSRKAFYKELEKIGFHVTDMDDIDGYFKDACSIINSSHDLAIEIADKSKIDKIHFYFIDKSGSFKRQDWSRDQNGQWHCIFNSESDQKQFSMDQLKRMGMEPSLFGLIQRSTYKWFERLLDIDDNSIGEISESAFRIASGGASLNEQRTLLKDLQSLYN